MNHNENDTWGMYGYDMEMERILIWIYGNDIETVNFVVCAAQCKIDRPGCVSRQILYFSRKIQYHKENVQKTTRLTPIVDAIVSFNHPAKF